MENIPTITSCGVFTLKSASLYAGLLDVIFSSCNIITLWTQIPWSTPIAGEYNVYIQKNVIKPVLKL